MERKIREWTLYEEIGRGSMGVVYRATHDFLPGEWAVKEILLRNSEDEDLRKGVLSEAIWLAELRHPNIVRFCEPFVEDGRIYIAIERVQGQSLDSASRSCPDPWEPSRAVGIVRQAADGLGYCHRKVPPVLHLDVTPANIQLLADDRVKLQCFGLAYRLGGRSMAEAGRMVGTPAYMSPEMLLGKLPTARSDVYSLGIVLYRLLAGRPPYERSGQGYQGSAIQAIMFAGEGRIPDVRQFNPRVSRKLAAAVDACLSCDPARRPADGLVMSDMLLSSVK